MRIPSYPESAPPFPTSIPPLAPSNKVSPLPNTLKVRQAECRVSSGLYILFRLSQLIGIAPVKFTREDNDWRMESTGRRSLLAYFIMGLVAIGSLKFTVLNFDYTQEDLVDRKQFLGAVTYRGMIFIVLVCACVSVYGAPGRVRAVVECLQQLQKISSQIENKKSDMVSEKKKCLLIVFVFMLKIITFCMYFLTLIVDKDLTLMFIMSWLMNYCIIVLLVFLMLQFALPAVDIYKAFHLINNVLEQLLSEHHNECFKLGNLRVRAANSPEETINSLAIIYSTVSDVVNKIMNASGLGILLLLIIILTHFIFMAYYIIELCKFLFISG
ncbi:hypothetical protein ACJJTC_006039 [Scirpophaga incertulas]